MKRNLRTVVQGKRLITIVSALTISSVLGFLTISELNKNDKQDGHLASVGHGDVNTLAVAANNWRKNYEANGGSAEVLKLSLGYSKVISEKFTNARGSFQFNLKTGELVFTAKDLEKGNYDLWLVNNLSGSAMPRADDKLINIGTFSVADGSGSLATQLARSQLLGFTMDNIVLSHSGMSPRDGG
ncbi:MAG: hypothetical protein ACU836_05205, partial [Gammaproteobacteria bacterium]